MGIQRQMHKRWNRLIVVEKIKMKTMEATYGKAEHEGVESNSWCSVGQTLVHTINQNRLYF